MRGVDGVAHKRKVSDAAEAIELYRSVFGIVRPREMEAGLTQAVAHFIAGGIAMQFHSPAYFG